MYKVKNQLQRYFVQFSAGQAHSSVERAGLLGGVQFRLLEADAKNRLRGDTLAEAVTKDKQQGLIPFYVCTILLNNIFLSFVWKSNVASVENSLHFFFWH